MRWLFTILSFLVVCSCIWIGYLWVNHGNLEKRIRNLEFIIENRANKPLEINHPPFKMHEADSLRRAIDIRDIKQQYYLTQMDIQSNWYILFVTVLFGVFAIVGYGFVAANIESVAKENKKQKKKQEFHIAEVEKSFKVAEANTYRALASSINFQCNYCAEKGHYRSALKTETDLINVILRIKELDEDINEFNNAVLNSLKKCLSNISRMYDVIDTNHLDFTFFFTSSEAVNYKNYFDNLYAKVNDSSREEVKKIISKLEQGIEKGKEIKKKNKAKWETDVD